MANLTDQEAIKALKKANILELEEMVTDYPESDRDGRTDWDLIANEAGWLLDMFNSGDTAHSEDLKEAKEIVYRFRTGRMIYWQDGRPMWDEIDHERAKRTIREYNRLARFVSKLKQKGLYCPYC